MKIAFITMQFPVPSETFASNDVRKFADSGVTVEVHGLRQAHERHDELVTERRLDALVVTHNSLRVSAAGAGYALSRPLLLARTLAWLITTTLHQPGQLFSALALLPRSFDVLRRLSTDPPDVVHLAWGHYPAMVGYLVQRDLPDVTTSISLAAYDLERQFGGTVEVARRADIVRTLAFENVAPIERFCGVSDERVEVIYDGVDLQTIDRIVAAESKVSGKIALASRLIASKRVDDAVRIFAAVHGRQPESSLVVMGDGPERRALEQLACQLGVEEEVTFRGHVAHDEVLKEFARAEFALMTSAKSSERLPNVVKEAMACGCICITSETPGIRELVPEGAGFVFPPHDLEAAVEAIDAVFAGGVNAAEWAAEARTRIEERFDISRTAKRYLQLWEAASEARRARPAGSELTAVAVD